MRIAIVGHGFVGKAVDQGFTVDCEKYIVDPNYGTTIDTMYQDQFIPDVVFISVPTPMREDGSIDPSHVLSTLEKLGSYVYVPVAIIKSTVTPDVLKDCSELYPRVVYNPEFLTERNAVHDFVNPHALVLGGDEKDVEFCERLYSQHSTCNPCPVYRTTIAAASMLKYAMNSFLATKVLFFNQLKEVYDRSDTKCSWEYFTRMLAEDTRIGHTHMQVPGPDGRLGFGGACFLKDTSALLEYSSTVGANFSLLERAVEDNRVIRAQYPELDPRESAQNVNLISRTSR